MNLFRRTKPDLEIDDYRHGAHVTGAEIAALFGVSPGRVRQMAGSRENPDAILKAPRSGTNGTAEWPLRNVLQYAMTHGRSVDTTLPPLLPRPDGQARYEPEENGRPFTLKIHDKPISVWAQRYRPTRHTAPHNSDGDLLLIVRLWPDTGSRDYAEIAAAYTQETDPGRYSGRDADAIALTVVEIPSADALAMRARIHTQYVTAGDLQTGGMPPTAHLSSLVEATDIAACLGWPAVPVWPEGTATAATVAVWRPGTPVPISVPAKWQDLWSAGRHAALRAGHDADPAMATSYRALNAAIQMHMVNDARKPYSFADGTESAVDWEIDEPAREDFGNWIPAVDDIVSSSDVPPFVADTLLAFFGDWRYSRPVTLFRSTLPAEWARRFEQVITTATPIGARAQSARLRALERTAADASDGTAFPMLCQSGHTIIAVTAETITWLAWNGYNDPDDNELSNSWPENVAELLITMDPSTRRHSAWAATIDDSITALPHSQGALGFVALTRSGLGHTQGLSPQLDSVLQATTPEQPSRISYPDFLRRLVDDEVRFTD